MNNPRRILQTLDGHLTAPAEITLFGRAALALGDGLRPFWCAPLIKERRFFPLRLDDSKENN